MKRVIKKIYIYIYIFISKVCILFYLYKYIICFLFKHLCKIFSIFSSVIINMYNTIQLSICQCIILKVYRERAQPIFCYYNCTLVFVCLFVCFYILRFCFFDSKHYFKVDYLSCFCSTLKTLNRLKYLKKWMSFNDISNFYFDVGIYNH